MKSKIVLVMVIIATLFAGLFLHEMGHCLAFRHNGFEVEKVSVAAIWKFKLTVFTDSRGTEYELGPLPIGGYTLAKETDMRPNLAEEVEIDLAGVAVNALVILLFTPWYFLLRRPWRKRGIDFVSSFSGKIFRVFITINLLILIANTLWLDPYVDGGNVVCIILSQRFGELVSLNICFGLGLASFIYLVFDGFNRILKAVNKIYGWTDWPGPKKKKD